MTEMTRRDRDDLAKLCRKREAHAKTMASERAAMLRAQFEQQLAEEYSFDEDVVWNEAAQIARNAATEAQAMIAERCDKLGIPPEFAPHLDLAWHARGANSVRGRRSELTRVAKAKIEAMEKTARSEITRLSLETQTALLAGGLDSGEAREFLERMPSAEALMPSLELGEIKRALGAGDGGF